MSDDGKRVLSGADEEHAAPQRAGTALKTWVTPKVITSTITETELGSSAGSDGGGGGLGGKVC